MSQTWEPNCYALNHTGTTDLQNMENNFESLKSSFSGSSAPGYNEAGMVWFDTSKKSYKVRNQANSAWLACMYGNSSNKIWMYLNSATDGWVLWNSATDRVLAIRGGSQAYNISGGSTAGSWTQPSHALTTSELPSHTHTYSSTVCMDGNAPGSPVYPMMDNADLTTGSFTVGATGGGFAHNHGNSYRPAAAVGRLFYPYA